MFPASPCCRLTLNRAIFTSPIFSRNITATSLQVVLCILVESSQDFRSLSSALMFLCSQSDEFDIDTCLAGRDG